MRALTEAGAAVRALTRNPADPVPDGAERATGDLNDPRSLRTALQDVRGVFFLPGYDDMPGLMTEARDACVDQLVQLSGTRLYSPSNAHPARRGKN